jgi:hypothetical protein
VHLAAVRFVRLAHQASAAAVLWAFALVIHVYYAVLRLYYAEPSTLPRTRVARQASQDAAIARVELHIHGSGVVHVHFLAVDLGQHLAEHPFAGVHTQP